MEWESLRMGDPGLWGGIKASEAERSSGKRDVTLGLLLALAEAQ